MPQRTIVQGSGNTLLADEGAGVHAIRHLRIQCRDRPDVELVDAGTLSFTLAPALQGYAGLIVIDAADLRDAAGAVRLFEGEAMDRFLVHHRRLSAHEVSLLDLAVVPSTWNAGRRDAQGQDGPYEAALKGHRLHDPKQPIEILRTIHSFDPCIACAVHVTDPRGGELIEVKVR